MKKWLTISNLLSVLLVTGVILLALNRYKKSFVLRNMMKLGFYQPMLSPPVDSKDESALMSALSFKNSDGKVINIADQKGKVVFIDFWATWCPYCVAEMPGINQLYLELKAHPDIVFIIADADHDFNKSTRFMSKHQYGLPVHSLTGNLPTGISDGTIPLTIILDKNGHIVYKNTGTVDYSSPGMLAYIKQLASAK